MHEKLMKFIEANKPLFEKLSALNQEFEGIWKYILDNEKSLEHDDLMMNYKRQRKIEAEMDNLSELIMLNAPEGISEFVNNMKIH
jgi:hypothetical protein